MSIHSEQVDVSVHQGLGLIRLNRPDKLNALMPDMVEAVHSSLPVSYTHLTLPTSDLV